MVKVSPKKGDGGKANSVAQPPRDCVATQESITSTDVFKMVHSILTWVHGLA